MPILLTQGNLFACAMSQALVNPVNCVGVMGAGLAKQFAVRFPNILAPYKQACAQRLLRPGVVTSTPVAPQRWVINLPTKIDWRKPSQLAWVEAGLKALDAEARRLGVTHVALPPLGCGLGGLRWPDVLALIRKHLGQSPVVYRVYQP